jgi:hypothetical protein
MRFGFNTKTILDLVGNLVDVDPVQLRRVVRYRGNEALPWTAPVVLWKGEKIARERVILRTPVRKLLRRNRNP